MKKTGTSNLNKIKWFPFPCLFAYVNKAGIKYFVSQATKSAFFKYNYSLKGSWVYVKQIRSNISTQCYSLIIMPFCIENAQEHEV